MVWGEPTIAHILHQGFPLSSCSPLALRCMCTGKSHTLGKQALVLLGSAVS